MRWVNAMDTTTRFGITNNTQPYSQTPSNQTNKQPIPTPLVLTSHVTHSRKRNPKYSRVSNHLLPWPRHAYNICMEQDNFPQTKDKTILVFAKVNITCLSRVWAHLEQHKYLMRKSISNVSMRILECLFWARKWKETPHLQGQEETKQELLYRIAQYTCDLDINKEEQMKMMD